MFCPGQSSGVYSAIGGATGSPRNSAPLPRWITSTFLHRAAERFFGLFSSLMACGKTTDEDAALALPGPLPKGTAVLLRPRVKGETFGGPAPIQCMPVKWSQAFSLYTN